MTLSRARSPQRTEESFRSLFRDIKLPFAAPATPAEIVELRDQLWSIAKIDYGRLAGHMTANRLAEIDHLIAIHVMGYVFNEKNELDSDMERWTWRTGLGTFCDHAPRLWTTDTDLALLLLRQYTPKLRLSVRVGDGLDGQISHAAFSPDHPVRALRGKRIPLPKEWPGHVRRWPAIGIVHTFLTALALQQREAAKIRPKPIKKAPPPAPKPRSFEERAATFS